MLFTEEGKASINDVYLITDYGLRRLMTEFSGKIWKRYGLDKLLTKTRKTGTSQRKHGGGLTNSSVKRTVLADDMLARAGMIQELVMVMDGLLTVFVWGLFCTCRH